MGFEKALAKNGFMLSTVDAVTNWARTNAMWPMPMGLACCAIEMMAFASTGGMKRVYGVTQGVDHILPVDVYIPGCPPRPETVIHALMTIQEKVRREHSVAND